MVVCGADGVALAMFLLASVGKRPALRPESGIASAVNAKKSLSFPPVFSSSTNTTNSNKPYTYRFPSVIDFKHSDQRPLPALPVAQKLVDSGFADNLTHAGRLFSQKGVYANAQKIVDAGDARTLKEAFRVQGKRNHEAKVSKWISEGKASTREEVARLAGTQARKARFEKLGEDGDRKEAQRSGAISAVRQGKHFKFAGVIPSKNSRTKEPNGRWLVQFRHKGERINLPGSFPTERDAAIAHDNYVRQRNFDRVLHRPDLYDGGIDRLGASIERKVPLPPLHSS